MSVIEPDVYYVTAKLCRLLNVSSKKLRAACEQGQLRHVPVTKDSSLFRGQWVIEWLETLSRESTTKVPA